MEHFINEVREKIVNPRNGTTAPFVVNKIINNNQVSADPFDGQYLDRYQQLASNPESKIVDIIKAHNDCTDIGIHGDKIQAAYDNGERIRNSLLNKTK